MESADAATADTRDAQRVIAFSDAVVAIAITLVVLPLVDSARTIGQERLGEYFSSQYPALIAAGVSFATIALFWNGHRKIYRNVLSVSNGVFVVNILWLASIVAIPITTVINVAYAGADRGALLLYVGTITSAHALSRLQGDLVQLESARHTYRPGRSRLASWTSVLLMLVGMISIAAFGWPGSIALLLLLLDTPLDRLLQGDTRRRTRT